MPRATTGSWASPSEHLKACTIDFARRRRFASARPHLRPLAPSFLISGPIHRGGTPVNLLDFRGKRAIFYCCPNEPNARL
jgi:hypothetical protein